MTILKWALIFFLVSVVAGILGFTGISAASADVARFLFYVFVVIFLVLLILGLTIFQYKPSLRVSRPHAGGPLEIPAVDCAGRTQATSSIFTLSG